MGSDDETAGRPVNRAPLDMQDFAATLVGRLNARDVEGFLAYVHPEARFEPLLPGVGVEAYEGHDGVRAWLRDVWGTWESYTVGIEGVHGIDERVGVLEVVARLRAPNSSVTLETISFAVLERDETLRWTTGWKLIETREDAEAEARRWGDGIALRGA